MAAVSLEAPTEFPPQAAESRVPVRKREKSNNYLNLWHDCGFPTSSRVKSAGEKRISFLPSNYDMTVSQGFSSRAPRSFPILTSSPRREQVALMRGPWTTPMECTDSLQMRKLTSPLATTFRGAIGEARGTKCRQQRWSNGKIWTKVNNLNKGEAMEWFEGLGRPQEQGNSPWKAAETEEDPILGLILIQFRSLDVHLKVWSDDFKQCDLCFKLLPTELVY